MNIKWQDLEFEERPKTADWFWALWIIAIGVAIFSVMKGSIPFGILIIIIAFTLSLQAVRKPKTIDFQIDETGISIDKAKYPFKNLVSFWVTDDSRLIVKTKNSILSHIVLPLQNTDEEIIEDFLSTQLEKEEHNEPVIHKIAKHL